MPKERFAEGVLSGSKLEELKALARACRGDILKMTTIAGSGHPGGSMSSLEVFILLHSFAKLDPARPEWQERDRIVVSHGHTSPGVYSVLGRLGWFDVRGALSTFRKIGSVYEGHLERSVPGVEWSTGNLGQGLSAACGFAIAARLKKTGSHVYCVMGDGEQQKGMISEARRFAIKYGLNNLTAIIDVNRLQLTGPIADTMPQNTEEEWRASGWQVESVDGHDLPALYGVLKKASREESGPPVCIMANTVMSKGVSFMEDNAKYHGAALKEDQLAQALKELGVENDVAELKEERKAAQRGTSTFAGTTGRVLDDPGKPKTYDAGEMLDCRGAFGAVMEELGERVVAGEECPVAVVDCDLYSSTRTSKFKDKAPDNFFQTGIQEHHAAAFASALATDGVLTIWSDFGVFGVDETYNIHRLADINEASLKVVCTHCGLDVGEDGKTHQCIDYAGIAANLYGYKLIVPSDANQTDRAVRYVLSASGPFFIIMGRSKIPVLADEDGKPLFGGDYEFEYGKADVVREGEDACIIAMGQLVTNAVEAHNILRGQGVLARVLAVSCPISPDVEAIRAAAGTGAIVTVEDHNVRTGLGAWVGTTLADEGLAVAFRRLGVLCYAASAKPDALYRDHGLDPNGIVRAVQQTIARKK